MSPQNSVQRDYLCQMLNQTISRTSGTENIGNVVIAGSGTKTLGSAIGVFNLTINAGAILDPSASNYAVKVSTNWTNNGTFIERNGTVEFNSGGSQSIGGSSITNFYDLSIVLVASSLIFLVPSF